MEVFNRLPSSNDRKKPSTKEMRNKVMKLENKITSLYCAAVS